MTEDRSVLDRVGREPDAVIAYGAHADQCIEVFLPSRASASARVVVLVHGGYWRPEWDRAHMRPLAERLADDGWTVASVEYRRIPGDPDAMTDDLRSSLQRTADALSSPATLVGFSAGGHLALWCAADEDLVRHVCRVVALAPVADLRTAEALDLDEGGVRAFLGGPAEDRPDLDPLRLTPRVPVHLIHDPDDERVPIALAEAYAAAHGADARLVTLDRTTGGHFALIDPDHETGAVVRSRLHPDGGAGTMQA